MTARFEIQALDQSHDRRMFDCGVAALNRYFAELVTQDVRRRIATCFVAVETGTDRLAGYYTLAAAAIALEDLPPALTKRLPRYPTVPAVRIGRLAIDRSFQQRGLGATMLIDALERGSRADIAAYAAVVDAIDDAAVAFYRHHGFLPFGQNPRQLFLPLATFAQARAKPSVRPKP